MARIWSYGDFDYFGDDIEFSLWALDDVALLELKSRPAKLDGRKYYRLFSESIARRVKAEYTRDVLQEIEDVCDEELDIVSEHAANKTKHRKHRDVSRMYQVRKPDYNASCKLKERRKAANRCSRQNLNKLEVLADKDIVRKYRSTFVDAETWSIRGSRNLDVRR